MANDVIAAVATPAGRGGIAVVRISGPQLRTFLERLIGQAVKPRQATLSRFPAADGSVIDHGLVLYFPAPHSYTGEDVVELQGHGGPVVVSLLLERCLQLGARIAEPGEFTKRAFLNDKLDLAQAEGVADLINATTATAARCAMRSLEGEFSARIHALVEDLVELRTIVEATLDFPEEEIEFVENAAVRERLARLTRSVGEIFEASRQGRLLREGVGVVLAGAPNVGKSSLLNRLAGAERAIVTDIPGTTRDTIREAISISGVPIHIIDTAGLRDAHDPVEQIGIARSHDAILGADLVLWIADAARPDTRTMDAQLVARLDPDVPRLFVLNKTDLFGTEQSPAGGDAQDWISISAKTGAGLDALREVVLRAVGWGGGEAVFLARARHLEALRTASGHLTEAAERVSQLELCAEELRLAQQALGSITGEISADDLLGRIFSQFCIGK